MLQTTIMSSLGLPRVSRATGLLPLLACITLTSRGAPAESHIKIQGVIENELFGQALRGIQTVNKEHPTLHLDTIERREFTCEIIGCVWQITVSRPLTNENGVTKGGITYHAGCDGTNVYWLQEISRKYMEEKFPGKDVAGNFGIVKAGVVPIMSDDDARGSSWIAPVWFAFASSCYLDSRVGAQIKPIWTIHKFAETEPKLDPYVKLERFTRNPRLPAKTQFNSSGFTIIRREDGEFKIERYKPPFEFGFTDANYEATGFANIGGLSIPHHATLTRFWGIKGAKTADDVEITSRMSMEVTGVKTIPIDPLAHSVSLAKPMVAGRTVIIDDSVGSRAARHGPPAQYSTTNGWGAPATTKGSSGASPRLLIE